MTKDEINKIIAEYMGVLFCECCKDGWDGFSRGLYYNCSKCKKPHTTYLGCENKYTKSLDELVPVWEKIPEGFLQISLMASGLFRHEAEAYRDDDDIIYIAKTSVMKRTTIQHAAAEATAKAILELSND